MRILDHGYRGHRQSGRLGAAFLVVLGAFGAAVASEQAPMSRTAGDTPDAETRRVGEEVRQRLTTYSDEQKLTLSDGQAADMTVKPNRAGVGAVRITAHLVAGGTEVELRALDAAGKPMGPRAERSATIHDGSASRMAIPLGPRRDVFGKIELTPQRIGTQVTLDVRVLFATPPTAKETEAAMLTKGKEGQVHLAFKAIATAVAQHKRDHGVYPANLGLLKMDLPRDVFSATGEAYRYEAERGRFILSSCGEDGVYGNDDDEVLIFAEPGRATSGQRHELYPLKPAAGQGQVERLAPSGRRPAGTCLLAGQVLDAGGERPVGHATVYLAYGATDDPLFVTVAADGGFELRDIPCGAASLTVIRTAGYQDAAYDPENVGGRFPRFTLAEKEQRRDIAFKLQPAYRISGRVLDEAGRPFSDLGVYVYALAPSPDPKAGALRKQASVRPDGTYVLDGLSGQPILLAVQDARAEQKDAPYPVRYYPGTFSRAEAAAVAFGDKPSLENMDIQLARTGGLVVEGRVSDAASGAPIANALVVVHHEDSMFERITGYTNSEGRYHLEGLGAGALLVQADARPQNYVRSKARLTFSAGAKPASLDFALHKGVTITGTIVDESAPGDSPVGPRTFGSAKIQGSSMGAVASVTGVRHKYEPAGVGMDMVAYSRGEGEDEWCPMIFPSSTTFSITGMKPGPTVIELMPGVPDKHVVHVRYQGKDMKDAGIDTVGGQKMENVQIVLGKGMAPERAE
jgi:hypothetical protein